MFLFTSVYGQQEFSYHKVKGDNLSGRLSCMKEVNTFGRLPASLQEVVRPPVWSLGENAAGIYVDFKTDSDSIRVKYKVKGPLSMAHMPTIGVSGVDLYLHEQKNNRWAWAFGNYSFKDTVTYSFANIGDNSAGTFRLYLPMYNTVEFLEIGVTTKSTLSFVVEQTKPIVVYGTSIAQGACASRPGMAWTNILSRDFTNPVINVAFSGNGRLEQPILDLIVQEDAAVYILDCIPNLSVTSTRSAAQLDSLILNAVHFIQRVRPTVPIILTEHSSAFTPGFLNVDKREEYAKSTRVGQQTYDKMKKQGIKNIYYLSSEAIGLDVNSTVDYAHPNDWGMMKIAKAYAKVLKPLID